MAILPRATASEQPSADADDIAGDWHRQQES